MRKSLCAILIFVSISLGIRGQTFWKQYSPQFTLPSSSVVTPDNGLMIASLTSDSGYTLLHILRIDSAGNTIFSLQNYLTPDTLAGIFNKIINTSDGNFLAMGRLVQHPTINTISGIYLHKFDINGNTIWDRFIYNDSCQNVQLGESNSIIESSDGGFAMSGSVYLHALGSIEAMFILKTDSTGNPLWYKIYNIGRDLQNMRNNICEKNDSGFAAFAQVDGIQQDAILISTDKNGSVQSSYTLDSTNLSRLKGIFKFHNSIYLSFYSGFVKTNLDTNSFTFTSYDDLSHDFQIESIDESTNSDFLLTFTGYDSISKKFGGMRVDTSGNIIWAHAFNLDKLPKALRELPDGSYILDGIGYIGSTHFIEVMKLDTTGNIACYNDSYHISTQILTEKFSPFPVNADSTCQLSTLPVNLSWHNAGTITDYCFPTGVNETVGNSTSIFPNPTSGIVYINVKNKQVEISIYDILGNRLINERIKDDMNSIDLTFLSPGIYLCKISSADNEEIVKLAVN